MEATSAIRSIATDRRLFSSKLSDLLLDAENRAFVFDALMNPQTADQVAALASEPEQAANLIWHRVWAAD